MNQVDHVMSTVRNSHDQYRTVCSCGKYKSKWCWYPGRAEIAWRAHARAKGVRV